MLARQTLSALLLCLLGSSAPAVDLDEMRQKMLGDWEILFQRDGYTQRNVKSIDSEYETMSIYLNGQLLNKWRCRWELEAVGDFAVYRFSDFEVLQGQRVFPSDYSGSYLLRVTDVAWYEMVRMEAGASGQPRFDAFRRVGADPVQTGNIGIAERAGPLAPSITPGRAKELWPSRDILRSRKRPPARPWKGSEAEWFDISAGDESRQRQLERLAIGAWRCERPDGTVIEKQVSPGVEVVALMRDDELVRVWKTKWRIRVQNGIATFWFNNYELIEGERSAPDGISGGYALSIVDNTWTEVSGMIGQTPNPPTLSTFERVVE